MKIRVVFFSTYRRNFLCLLFAFMLTPLTAFAENWLIVSSGGISGVRVNSEFKVADERSSTDSLTGGIGFGYRPAKLVNLKLYGGIL